jgi:hypothetical protein
MSLPVLRKPKADHTISGRGGKTMKGKLILLGDALLLLILGGVVGAAIRETVATSGWSFSRIGGDPLVGAWQNKDGDRMWFCVDGVLIIREHGRESRTAMEIASESTMKWKRDAPGRIHIIATALGKDIVNVVGVKISGDVLTWAPLGSKPEDWTRIQESATADDLVKLRDDVEKSDNSTGPIFVTSTSRNHSSTPGTAGRDEEPTRIESPPAIEWADAKKPVQHGGVQVRITRVVVDKVRLKSMMGGESESKEKLCQISLQITNTDAGRKIDYRGWQSNTFMSDARLTDDAGNRYKGVHFGFSNEIVGQVESESIYPGKNVDELLVFEAPIDASRYLNLELPASNIDGTGKIQFHIPREFWRKSQKANNPTSSGGLSAPDDAAIAEKAKRITDAHLMMGRFTVYVARFYFRKETLTEVPVIELNVTNKTPLSVSRAYFHAILRSPGRAIPWVEADFNYTVPGGLERNESATWKLNPSMLGKWDNAPQDRADLVLTVEPVRLDGRKSNGEDVVYDTRP